MLLERRCWTSLSVAVVAACAWLLAFLGDVNATSPLFWLPALASAVSGGVCTLSSRALGQIARQARKARPISWVV